VTFVFLTAEVHVAATLSAIAAIVVTSVFRILTILFNWRTSALAAPEERDLTP
jgi:hypothetical protein